MKPATNEPATAGNQPTESEDPRLSFDQCWDLLAAATIGRLGLVVDDHPEIFPVNYVLDNRSIVFRTGDGRKLWSAMATRPAALEIDGYDPRTVRHVLREGDTALAIVDWTIKGTAADGNEVDLKGTAADVLRLNDQGWKLIIDNPFGTA